MQSEARNAKNAPECAICGVLPYRPAPTGCVLWLVPISNPRSAREHLQAPLPLAAPGLGPVLRFQLSAFSISAFAKVWPCAASPGACVEPEWSLRVASG
jgi:hypothetical protein